MTDAKKMPMRLHHTAYVTKDLEATRKFYEELLGFPLVATWCETDELFGKSRTYCHCFFGLSDGSALAFFQFAEASDQKEFGPEIPASPFHHIALAVSEEVQKNARAKLAAAGYKGPDTYELDHGYCQSLYVTDPNGMMVELTLDSPQVGEIDVIQRKKAHDELKRWLGGDHTSNNTYRSEHAEPPQQPQQRKASA